ncbi:hypothetical protein HGRIS_003398 [Hohenbuehelia grisea]|uniref:triacylglycerol lipase n=1 Tax=Hohenbuehelia grisea TaxID=104357 RepID=A0ABR3JFY0_9AGAR
MVMLPTTLTTTISTLLGFLSCKSSSPSSSAHSPSNPLQFELRHLHAVSPSARVVFADVSKHIRVRGAGNSSVALSDVQRSYNVGTRRVRTHRPASFAKHAEARLRSMQSAQSPLGLWEEEEVPAPDIQSRDTLLTLAKMTNNAYLEPEDPGWYDLGGNWSVSYPFGWQPDEDGFRGHVFATPDNSTIVLSIKGTSAGFLGGGGPTSKKDKFNDNLLFSCCCARVDWTWSTVCDCYRGGWRCNQECLESALIDDSLFYPIGTNLYNNLTYMYPDSNIWIIGHSLGGALASLLGTTFGPPVVTFESPGEKMAARRLHLPTPPSAQHITHVFHTADPIAMGTCTGVLSSCALGGYAMESRCHLGETILYDTVSNLSWSVDIRTHGIVTIIDKLLAEPWEDSEAQGREVPQAKAEEDCVECYSWEFGDFP